MGGLAATVGRRGDTKAAGARDDRPRAEWELHNMQVLGRDSPPGRIAAIAGVVESLEYLIL
jgi:hypothetical protein